MSAAAYSPGAGRAGPDRETDTLMAALAEGGGVENATTEIALALAMAFFSLLVLTFVSMSSTPISSTPISSTPISSTRDTAPDATATDVPARAPALFDLLAEGESREAGVRPLTDADRLVILHGGRLLDASMRPAVPEAIGDGRVVLAVDPSAAISDLLAARSALAGREVVMASLDDAWLRRLSSAGTNATTNLGGNR